MAQVISAEKHNIKLKGSSFVPAHGYETEEDEHSSKLKPGFNNGK